MVRIAEAALQEYPCLNKVVIVKTSPRFDLESDDPLHLKPQLAQLIDSVYFSTWSESRFKDKIVLGNHNIEEWSKLSHDRVFGSSNLPNHDGIHLVGPSGSRVYTNSLISIFKHADLTPLSSQKQ